MSDIMNAISSSPGLLFFPSRMNYRTGSKPAPLKEWQHGSQTARETAVTTKSGTELIAVLCHMCRQTYRTRVWMGVGADGWGWGWMGGGDGWGLGWMSGG